MFFGFFNLLQAHLHEEVNDSNKDSVENQSFLLCGRQINVCIKYLEITTAEERNKQSVLITARQCFFDRIIWCLGRLKNTISNPGNCLTNDQMHDDSSFIELLDYILGSLSIFINSSDNDQSTTNLADKRAELMMESRKVEEGVRNLLSMLMTFSNISLAFDKNPLTILSQKLFRISKEFKDEFSLADAKKTFNICGQRMKASELESALYKLENYVNDSLLRLVYQVFNDINSDPIGHLQKTQNTQDIEQFDMLIERFLLIGQFAISFCKDDIKILSVVRSCLASIETLDSYLIPAITSQTNDPSIEILKLHFYEEALELQTFIHFIIDTKAFCISLMEQIIEVTESNKKCFNKSSLYLTVDFAKILLTHLNVNAENLKLSQDKVLKFYFNDFKLILTECEAILNFPDPIDEFERRVLKRFNILKNTIKKLTSAMKIIANEFDVDENLKTAKIAEEFPSKCFDYFNSIRPSALSSILYESKRSMKYPKNTLTTPNKKKNKNESLRMAMFKKNDIKFEGNEISGKNDSTNLHITEILDQLSSLSIHIKKK